jgi:hypothetical protein
MTYQEYANSLVTNTMVSIHDVIEVGYNPYDLGDVSGLVRALEESAAERFIVLHGKDEFSAEDFFRPYLSELGV